MEQVRRLWAGEPFEGTDGAGKPVRVRTYPTPVQKALPMWITAAGSERSFQKAGEMGVDLLTHLFDQDVETLARKVGAVPRRPAGGRPRPRDGPGRRGAAHLRRRHAPTRCRSRSAGRMRTT